MRKLGLLGVLGAILGLALLLESFVTRLPRAWGEETSRRAVVVLGRAGPLRIPVRPPEPDRDTPESGLPVDAPPAATPQSTPERRPAQADPVAAEQRDSRFHVVRGGESLSEIAEQHLGSHELWRELARWNSIEHPDRLLAGTRLRLDPPGGEQVQLGGTRSYRVQPGDTLGGIAARLLGEESRWREIGELNGVSNPSSLQAGTVLRIPEQ